MAGGLWIKVSVAFLRHPKLKKFSRMLVEDRLTAAGRLLLLWSWAMEFYPDGVLPVSIDDIAEAMEWTGSVEVLMKALCCCGKDENSAGFVDTPPENQLFILHDWDQYGGELAAKKAQKSEWNKRAYAKRKTSDQIQTAESSLVSSKEKNISVESHESEGKNNASETSNEVDAKNSHDSSGNLNSKYSSGVEVQSELLHCKEKPELIQENQSQIQTAEISLVSSYLPADSAAREVEEEVEVDKRLRSFPKPGEKNTPGSVEKSEPYRSDFEEWWETFPRKVDKKATYQHYVRLRREKTPKEALLRASRIYAKSRSHEDPTYTLYPSTFLGPKDKWRDYLEPEQRLARVQQTGPGIESLTSEQMLERDMREAYPIGYQKAQEAMTNETKRLR